MVKLNVDYLNNPFSVTILNVHPRSVAYSLAAFHLASLMPYTVFSYILVFARRAVLGDVCFEGFMQKKTTTP